MEIHFPNRLVLQDTHGATSQKTAFFRVTAVETSNPTYGATHFLKRRVLQQPHGVASQKTAFFMPILVSDE
jgi:hypothetical protein